MAYRSGKVLLGGTVAGSICEIDTGYCFVYHPEFLKRSEAQPISLTLPLQADPYLAKVLFPFFDGLIPEGWLLDVAEKMWKLNSRDRMGLLLACCQDCIGNVSVQSDDIRP